MDLNGKYLSIKYTNRNGAFNYRVLDNNRIQRMRNEEEIFDYRLHENEIQLLYDNRIIFDFIYNEGLTNDYNNEYVFYTGHDSNKDQSTLMIVDSINRIWDESTHFACYNLIKKGLLESVGEHTYGRFTVPDHYPTSKIRIGDYCSLAEGIKIIMCDHSYTSVSSYPFNSVWHAYNLKISPPDNHVVKNQTLTIGNDVWIGADVKILPGVSYIGDGAIIAAGSIVTKDVEPYSVVAGVPAKLLKYRFNKEQIDELLKIKWWEWNDETIKERINDIVSHDIDSFIEKYKNTNNN